MTDFRDGGLFATPNLSAAPKRPVLNRVKTSLDHLNFSWYALESICDQKFGKATGEFP